MSDLTEIRNRYPVLIEEMETFILERDHVTFVELARILEDKGVDPNGTFSISAGNDPNLIFWWGASEVFADLSFSLLKTFEISGSSLMIYMIDGGFPDLPMAKRPPKNGYKKPHWAPIVFRSTRRDSENFELTILIP